MCVSIRRPYGGVGGPTAHLLAKVEEHLQPIRQPAASEHRGHKDHKYRSKKNGKIIMKNERIG